MLNKTDKQLNKLRTFNFVMGCFHLLQGILLWVLSTDFTLPINTYFLKFNQATMNLQPVEDTVWELRLAPWIAVFLFMSAAAHFIISSPGIYEWYAKNLKNGINYARWYEYAFSSSLMIVIISLLVGIYDLSALIPIFGINAMMILFGLMMELHNQTTKKTDWTSFIYGSIAGIVPWIVIAFNLAGAGEGDLKPPTFVYWIFFTIFIFFNTFAINMFLQYKQVGKWKDYLFGEKMYIVLSLLAKSALAWQIFAGTLRPV
ncbi:heliorhodopsin HeR [Candidatus Dojkabacteria bacterium]|uniref:Heliorhodopsin HeR n=1 Tax=Candidatus Dojkabacteria bacterium TaxID=2099670 RepID=A0A955RJB1_9BACT|nr:heliorhodopsin HeR [Candidatus Dojkabacteria bacterium]